MKVLAVYSMKGGVGKTASAVTLAHLCALDGRRTLLWDLDPQGAASFTLRIRPSLERGGGKRLLGRRAAALPSLKGTDFPGLDLLPADFSYRHLDLVLSGPARKRGLSRVVAPLRERYDVLFLDCPPGISLLSEHVFELADALLVPVIPTVLSLRSLGRLVKHLRGSETPPRVLPFFTLVDRRKALHRRVCDRASAHVPWFLKATIPASSVVEQMAAVRAPLAAFAPRSRPAAAYRALWAEIAAALEGWPAEPPRRRVLRSLHADEQARDEAG